MTTWKCLVAFLLAAFAISLFAAPGVADPEPWVVYEGGDGPGAGTHVVLISGDQEYRSEEGLPQLGKILAERHGFTATVLFPINPETGAIDPEVTTNVPGTEVLESADLMIIASRFLHLPEEQMAPIDAYVNAGKPVIGLRTATHAFRLSVEDDPYDPYHHYSFNYDGSEWPGGFGRQVLGETWVRHQADSKQTGTRGRIAPGAESHPVLNGVSDGALFARSDAYGVRLPLPGHSRVLMLGEVVDGMTPDASAVEGEVNDPMMPVAWIRQYVPPYGETGQAFTTTMGSAQDLRNEEMRRLVVNASYHLLGMGVPAAAAVDTVGAYNPSPRGFDAYKEGVMPAAHRPD
jgi:hypothetical protein